MKRPERLLFTVTNDLNYDQRMIRICSSLSKNGYEVLLVGRKFPGSIPLPQRPFRQYRLHCLFFKGFLSYAEFNIRLFFYLLFKKTDLLCAIDLDTIIPCYLVSKIKNTRRVYDAHELFCEMKEIVTRPVIHRCWKKIEKLFVPKFRNGYTVNGLIASEFHKMYGVGYETIRNLPVLAPVTIPQKPERYILYQGAVNEGRCFETLIPAMKQVSVKLIICGDGNFMAQAGRLVRENQLENRIVFTGNLSPAALKTYTLNAFAGVNLIENTGLNNYYSLANRFFDYMHAGIPQICVNYPAYRSIIEEYPFAVLVNDTRAETLAAALNRLLDDESLYKTLQDHCLKAREMLNWNEEEKKLLSFYQQIFSPIG